MAPIQRSWTNKEGKTQTAWRVMFTFKRPDGTTVRVRETSPVNTKQGAVEYERQRRAALLQAPNQPKPSPKFKDFVPAFMTYSRNANKASTVDSKEICLRAHLIPAFGERRLDEITLPVIEQYKADKRAAGLKAKSCNNHLIVLKKILSLAVEHGELVAAPKVKKLKLPPNEFEFLDFDEAARFLAACPAEWYALLHTAMKTGLRFGELMELKWEDVDLVAGRINVRRNVWRGIVDTTKGSKAREVPLSDAAVAVLKAHRHLRGPYVFVQPDGTQLTQDVRGLKDLVPSICRKAGLAKRITMHDLRHTFASHLIMLGVPLAAVQQYLGHADITTTMVYAHLSPTARREWVALLDGPTQAKKEAK